MPPNTKCVDRSTSWGNPFKVGETKWLRDQDGNVAHVHIPDAEAAVQAFRWYVSTPERLTVVEQLRGYNLACWCPLDAPCHADVLLELANPGVVL